MLGKEVPGRAASEESPVRDATPPIHVLNAATLSANAAADAADGPMGPTAASALASLRPNETKPPRARPRLFDYSLVSSTERALRKHHGHGTPQTRVVFHDPRTMNEAEAATLAHIALPVLYNPLVNGLEDANELAVSVGTILIGRYKVVAVIGKGSFSRVFQCLDLRMKSMVFFI